MLYSYVKHYIWCFRKPWLRVKLVNFDISAQSSSTGYNESNKPTPKALAHIGSEKSIVEVGVPKSELFTYSYFSFYWKVYFSPSAVGSVKSLNTDYNESNKPNSKSLEIICQTWSSKKWTFSLFSHFSLYWKVNFFTPSHGFLKISITYEKKTVFWTKKNFNE